MNKDRSFLRLTRARRLFEEALELPETERESFLDESCGGDARLRSDVADLLGEAGADDTPFDQLLNEMVWPALRSLSGDPEKLRGCIDDLRAVDRELSDPLIGEVVSHFQIRAPIGRGGMGMVYLAHDRTLDRSVALKFLPPALGADPDAKKRFIREAKAASGLDHPNIATVHEIGETADHQLFIAMGYYPGVTLKEKIAQGPVSPEVAGTIALQLASGLEMAHAHGVVHRDIKPGNLIVGEDGSLRLLDFGLAKLSHESGYTQAGQMLGTLAYMSPEQARGDTLDARTDLWSFGVVLYEMLAGTPPFRGDNASAVIRSILEEQPSPLTSSNRKVLAPLVSIVGRCLEKDPDRRYQSATELRVDLLRAREGLAPIGGEGAARWKSWRRRTRLVAAGVGAIVVSGILFLVARSWRAAFADTNLPVVLTPIAAGPLVEGSGHFPDFDWGDYDNDGFLDLVIADQGEGGVLRLVHNEGDGTFRRVTDSEIGSEVLSTMCPVWADEDNDGDLDLFVVTDVDRDRFFRNDGAAGFTRVTVGDWVNTPGAGNVAAWGDYDSDGLVDLYVANFGTPEPQINFLYHNEGDGTMRAVATDANRDPGASHGCLWSDFDGDGDVDLFVGGQEPVQFRNVGGGSFKGVSPAEGGIPRTTEDVDVGFFSADYDNDGDLDVLHTTWKPEPSSLLYRNEGKSRFIDVTHVLPSGGSIRAMGATWGDYDNDGYLDLFIANRIGRNLLYHNSGDGTFERIANSPAVQEGRTSTECAWVDYDNDGDLDLFVANGVWSDFEERCELYRNDGSAKHHWLTLSLVGTRSNRSAIGAKVWIRTAMGGRHLTQLREIQGNGTTDPRPHFGLGDATVVDTVRIEWPSGFVQELHSVPGDQFITVTERVDPAGSRDG